MDRRSFLTRLLTGATALIAADKTQLLYALEAQGVVDPEKELWVPEERTLFMPGMAELEVVKPVVTIHQPGFIIKQRNVVVTLSNGDIELYNTLRQGAPDKVIRNKNRNPFEDSKFYRR